MMTPAEPVRFGSFLKRLRLAAELTQEALAERSGVSVKAIGELERDPARLPRLSTVTLVADALALDQGQRNQLLRTARAASSCSASPPPKPERGASPWPRPLTPLFGRETAIETVAGLIRQGAHAAGTQLLTLTGPGGVGKTRLAIAAAGRAADAFADGVLFVDLAPLRDPALVIPTIAQSVAIDERDETPLQERLAAALRRKQAVVLLDNFEHLLPARDHVLALLEACPRLVILVTSRSALRVRGEREYRIAPLALPERTAPLTALAESPVVALFLDRARAADASLVLTEATAPIIAEICHRLDGLPLAIELAAAWTRLLSPAALLRRLDSRLPLLVDGPHDLPARQRTMCDTIAWSYDLLTAHEQRLFRRLSVFAGGWTLEAAAAVCEMDEPTVLAGLVNLLDRNLLWAQDLAGEPRLSVLETLREYGLEQLSAWGADGDARAAHAAYYLDLAETAAAAMTSPDGTTWRHRLEREHDNLRTALDWALTHADSKLALRLGSALWRFWHERGHLSEGRQRLRQILGWAAADPAVDIPILIKVLVGAARLATDQGAYDEAEQCSGRAVALARERSLQRELVLALNTQGQIAHARSEYMEAARSHEEALALARIMDDQLGLAEALLGLGYATTWTGELSQGETYFARSLTAFQMVGDDRRLADALIGIALTRMHAGAFAPAETAIGRALELSRKFDDTGGIADALYILGNTLQFQGELERARTAFEENLILRRVRGDEHGAVLPLGALVRITLLQGDVEGARGFLNEALASLTPFDDRWMRGMLLVGWGYIDLATRDLVTAAAHFSEAISLFRLLGYQFFGPMCLEGLARIAATQADWHLTARLIGARDALAHNLGLGIPPFDPAAYARIVADSQSQLGDKIYAAAYAAGQALSPEQATASCQFGPS